jgi:hypothetical protein
MNGCGADNLNKEKKVSETTALTLPERAAVALGTPKYEQEIRELVAKTVTITEVKNKDGRDQCHGAMMTLKSTRVAIEKAAKAAREDATAFSKAVIAEEKRLVALAEPEEARLQGLRDAWDAEIEREKAAKAAAEKVRVDGIRAKIDEIKDCVVIAMSKSADEISSAIAELESTGVTLEDWAEFSGEAEMAKIATVAKLREMLAAQIEIERVAAEVSRQAEADRIERERIAAEQKAEAQRLADLAAEIEREAQVAREQREEADRQAQAARDEADRIAAAKLAEQQAEIDRQQAAIDAAKAEAERVERERLAAIEAEERRKAAEAAQALAAEAVRIQAEKDAAIAEQQRRERVEFIANGPGDVEIVLTLAANYGVAIGDAMQWMKKFNYESADEQFAAMNACGALPHFEQAA